MRRHLLLWIIAAAGVNGALIALTTMLMQLPGQRDTMITAAILVVLLCSVFSVLLPVAGHHVEEGHRLAEESRQQEQRIASLLASGYPGRLPALKELGDEQFGATPTRYTRSGNAPYIPRSPDDEKIRAALATPGPPFPFVLVWGPTKAGKSRILAEALRATLPDHTQVLNPVNGQALAELAHLGLPFTDGPALVYLDDLTVADLEALTAGVLDIVTGRAVLAATMTAKRRSQVLTSGGEITRTARAALARAHNDGDGHEFVFRAPTPEEHAQATKAYPDETFRGSIAETLVGGSELLAKYRAGQDDDPAGCAIVQAAVDARRAGLTRPLTHTELQRLFALYLPRIRAGVAATAVTYQHGLRWATTPIASQVALLNPASIPLAADGENAEAGWDVLDHLLSADDGALASQPARAIPDELWPQLIDLATPRDAISITYAAYQRNRLDHATTAVRKAMTSNDPDEAAAAAFGLGVLLYEQGEVELAQASYQAAIDSSHPNYAPAAAVNLGVLLYEQGEVKAAQGAYQVAIDSGHPDHAPMAAVNLGNLLKGQGDVQAAQAAYLAAINSGHPDEAPKAAVSLGVLLYEQGVVELAQASYQAVIDSSHPDYAPMAAVNLGNLFKGQGEVKAAQGAYQVAIDSGHPDHAPMAAVNLGNLLKGQGDVQAAQAAHQTAINSGQDPVAAQAQQALNHLLSAVSDPPASGGGAPAPG
ncbi:tetratricopeptide repeat protein [Nonomuraea sp. NPDC001636]|uniref:tetratricopeptide repeat protein n=1 Tax=Nonomuraea sp. NPDC001636 TaxID=3154391 RepID=UPI00331739FE